MGGGRSENLGERSPRRVAMVSSVIYSAGLQNQARIAVTTDQPVN
jgi:hypothetical protein